MYLKNSKKREKLQNKQTEETCASGKKVDPVAWKFRKVSERLTRFGVAIILL